MLRILFVSSGNSKEGISPIIAAQGKSIEKMDSSIKIDYFTIKGKGVKGYLKAISKLKKHLKNNNYDIVHAHYSLSAIVASLAGAKPLVVSLMGSDIKAKKWFKWLILFFRNFFWSCSIVKSEDMRLSLGFKNIQVIPNGVDLNVFYPQEQKKCQTKLNWDLEKKHILFPSNPERPEKNYQLLEDSVNQLGSKFIQIHTLIDVPHKDVPFYLNAADVVVMTSLWEGSPNAIKEAMACNRLIVTTPVGDTEWLLKKVEGSYITTFSSENVSKNIKKALEYSMLNNETKSRERIKELGLSSELIANKLIKNYKKNQ